MLIKLKKVPFFKNKEPFELSFINDIKKKIDTCWNEFIKDKSGYWNGDIIVVTNIDLEKNTVELGKTKYSSLIYAKFNTDLTIKSLFVAILLKTKDDKYVIIKNNHNELNIIGGLADKTDFENDKFIPELCIEREILEEIGIDLKDKKQVLEYHMKYLKVPTKNENYYPVGILYVGRLNYTSDEFEKYLNSHVFDGEIKECYFYSANECLNMKLKENDISYLKELIKLEDEIS